MSEPRDDAARAKDAASSVSWREFVSSALLVGAVAAILVTGWTLKVVREAPSDRAGRTPPPPVELPLGSTVAPEPAPPAGALAAPSDTPVPSAGVAMAEPPVAAPRPSVPPEPRVDPRLEALASRAAADASRLRKARGPWTAQILVACQRETVDRVVAAAGRAAKLYVLPAEVRGDACFRICWGAYPSAKDAGAAADLPGALRGKDRIAAVEIAKVLP